VEQYITVLQTEGIHNTEYGWTVFHLTVERQSKDLTDRSAPSWSGFAISPLFYWLSIGVKQVCMPWHRGIEGNEFANELAIT
jgi:hypothetical protein